MDYPNAEEELDVVSVTTAMNPGPLKPVVTAEWLREASLEVRQFKFQIFS